MSDSKQKFCKHCGQLIDEDCVVCPKCGKQIETIGGGKDQPIIINNSSSSSASSSAAAAAAAGSGRRRRLPFHLTWLGILLISVVFVPYIIIGPIMRMNWKRENW